MMRTSAKTLFAPIFVASTLAAATMPSAYAGEALTVYGKLNVTGQSNDVDGESVTEIKSNASRLGVKGTFDLGNSLEAFYTIEYEVDTGDDVKENFKARNQFVGVKGGFGAFSVGRNDTMLKKSQGKIDQFNDLSGDLKNLFKGENRLAQTATYQSSSIGGFKFGVTYAAEGDSAQQGQDGYSIAAMYGDAKLKKSPIYAAIAYDADVKGYEIVRASIQGKIAGLKLGGIYQQQEKTYDDGLPVTKESDNGFLFSAAYKIDAVVLKVQYQEMDNKGDSWSVGGDYRLGKPTKLFAFYSNRSYHQVEESDNFVGLGIEHKF